MSFEKTVTGVERADFLSDSEVTSLVTLHLESIKVQLSNMDRKLDDLARADAAIAQSNKELEKRVRDLEIDMATFRTKMAIVVGAGSTVAGILGGAFVKLIGL